MDPKLRHSIERQTHPPTNSVNPCAMHAHGLGGGHTHALALAPVSMALTKMSLLFDSQHQIEPEIKTLECIGNVPDMTDVELRTTHCLSNETENQKLGHFLLQILLLFRWHLTPHSPLLYAFRVHEDRRLSLFEETKYVEDSLRDTYSASPYEQGIMMRQSGRAHLAPNREFLSMSGTPSDQMFF